ncbi:MAG: helix-turn-helix transcriptional regulator [Rikenellaceae bacterium]
MKDKITYLMKSEGLTTTRLAEILEIQPSAVSHLVSGRNKPGYDLLQKILRRFPKINPDWLLLDSDTPYRNDTVDEHKKEQRSATVTAKTLDPVFDSMPLRETTSPPPTPPLPFPISREIPTSSGGSKSPIFVVVFYDDGSCENYSMRP